MKSTVPVHIRNGRLIDPGNGVDNITDLFIADGQIQGIGSSPENFGAQQVIDADGLIVCPGFVDLACQLREPGMEHKATIKSEVAAAASGGITTMVATPDTDPVIDTPAVWELIRHYAKAAGKSRVLAAGAMTQGLKGEQLAEMMSLYNAGCVVFSNGDRQLANPLVTRRVMDYASTFDLQLFIRAEDRHLRADGCVHDGKVAVKLGLSGIPTAAETLAVASHLALAAETRASLHFRGLSTAGAVQQIAQAQASNLPITADVAVHQLHLSEMDVDGFNSQCRVSPPLRTMTDREALRRALADGTISCLSSDHQPQNADAKNQPFGEAEAGISGLETLLPLSLKLVNEGVLDLNSMIRALTWSPAQVIRQPLGHLAPGAIADICIFDPGRTWLFDREHMVSAGHNSPFNGWEMTGKVTHTFFEGQLVYTDSGNNP